MSEPKKNVLHLMSWFPRPGQPLSGNFCLKHIRSVSDDVNSIVLSAYVDDNVKKREVEIVEHANFKQVYVHIPTSALPSSIRLFHAYNWGLKYIKKHFFNPDLVHLHVALPLGRVALYWRKRFGLKYVMTEHWTIYQPQNAKEMTPKVQRLIRSIANHAEVILPVSCDLQKNMQHYGITRPFRCIPNVVDTAIFHPIVKAPHEKKRLLHISTLRDAAKNFSGIVRVVEKLSKQRQDFVLDVVNDFENPSAARYVSEHHLEDFVVFHGKKEENEITDFYKNSDFFVLFSNFENLPCVIIESFACGLPVITTDVGGICEMMDDTRGITLHAGDEDALFNAINHFLDHYQEFDFQQIKEYAENHFSMPVIGAQLLQVYNGIQ